MKREHFEVLIVAIVGAAVGLFVQNTTPVGVFHDDGQYIILARSIAEQGTYRFDNLPGAPPGLHYPPGFPLFLAMMWKLAPGDIGAFRMANGLLLGAAAVAIFACARAVFGLSKRTAAVVAVAVAASAPLVWLNSMLLSETLFIAALCATLAIEAHGRDRGTWWHAGAGAAAAGAALVRSIGDPLGVIFIGERLLRRKWRDAAMLAGGWLAVLAPWKLWLRAHSADMPASFAGAYGDYGAWWISAMREHGTPFLRDVVQENASQLPITLSVLQWGEVPVMRWIVPAIFIAIAIVGAVRAQRARVALTFTGVYLAIVFIWPFAPDRFLMVLAPIVVGAFAVGAGVVANAVVLRGRAYVWTAGVVAVILGAPLLRMYDLGLRAQTWQRGLSERSEAGRAAARLVRVLPPNARIATDYDELVHIETGRMLMPARGLTAAEYVRPPSDSLAGERLRELVVSQGVTHIVVADVPTLRAVGWLSTHGVPMRPIVSDSAGAVVYVRVPVNPPGAQ
ncbi:MAG TPA: hypothetical protein VJR92_11300 [Gemmatimonadaceae bacterium]|nr:hypothetical protein [Gemmatimonadaceae bacterium]